MFDCAHVADELAASADPRLDDTYVRCLPGAAEHGPVLLVGVVHDHPASVARVVAAVEAFAPDTLALELPPLAVPLFRQYAADGHDPPRLGGEMSAAIRASDAPVLGVDAPTPTYLVTLLETLRRERPPLPVVGRLLKDLGSMAAHALATRVASLVASRTPVLLRVYDPIEHDASLLDPAEQQAADERAFLAQRAALFGAIHPPEATRLIDDAREEAIARLLDRARTDGSVVAVVGMEHLDPLAAVLQRLAAESVGVPTEAPK
jgi:pheromone shutdown protein TraB